MQRVVIGCTGWGYDEWVGVLYPAGTKPGDYLASYARAFKFTEVNSSYHRAPTREQVAQWAIKTPDDFSSSLKMPETIVRHKKLADAYDDIERFLGTLTPLRTANKLTRVVCALTPSFVYEKHFQNLEAFLDEWASQDPFAVELRHPSWWREETYALLRRHNVPLVWSATEHGRTPPVRTADSAYLRIVGDRNLDHQDADPTKPLLPPSEIRWDRIQRDQTPELEYWRDRVRDEARDALSVHFVINNHLSGFAPHSARLAARLLGLPEPDLEAARAPPLAKGQRRLDLS